MTNTPSKFPQDDKSTPAEQHKAFKVSVLVGQRRSLLAGVVRLQSAEVDLRETQELLVLVEKDLRELGWKPEAELAQEREALHAAAQAQLLANRDAAIARSVQARKDSEGEVEAARQRALAEQQRRAREQLGPGEGRANHTAA